MTPDTPNPTVALLRDTAADLDSTAHYHRSHGNHMAADNYARKAAAQAPEGEAMTRRWALVHPSTPGVTVTTYHTTRSRARAMARLIGGGKIIAPKRRGKKARKA